MKSKPTSRRRFLGQTGCAAMSSLPVLNTLLNLKLAGGLAAAAPANTEYRALVCLFFGGGIDSFNVLVPRGTAEHAEYASVRADLALAKDSLLPISPLGSPGLELGLHAGMSGLQGLFETGKAAFVSNVGTLVAPMTKAQYDQGSVPLPLGLFSHSDQAEQWQTSIPNQRTARGWAGKAADLLASLNGSPDVSMNISLSGSNVWQSGETVYEYSVNPEGATSLAGYNPNETSVWSPTPIRTVAIDRQLVLNYQHLITQAFNTKKKDAMQAYQLFNTATSADLPATVTFPDTYLGNQLKMVAKAIAGRNALGHTRQTFFINVDGWDHHDNVIDAQAEMLPMVSAAVTAFYQCLEAINAQNGVTLFTASDFGRTLNSNGAGSDHGWGGNHFVVGGAVDGRRIFGSYPSLAVDGPQDVGRGRLIPTTSVDAYFAELCLWLGVSKSNLSLVFPNIGAFYDTTGSSNPVGFLA
jgi:uncharacterized protein (DUF1501 family)